MPPIAVMLVSFSACVARLSAALGLQTGVGRCPLAINQLRIWACRPLSAPAPGVGGVVDMLSVSLHFLAEQAASRGLSGEQFGHWTRRPGGLRNQWNSLVVSLQENTRTSYLPARPHLITCSYVPSMQHVTNQPTNLLRYRPSPTEVTEVPKSCLHGGNISLSLASE